MSRYHSYINSAASILQAYTGTEPFAIFLKDFFKQHKKFGSTDRRQVSRLCYAYFRLGKMNWQADVNEKILAALFFCSTKPDEVLQALQPEWNKYVTLSLREKLALVQPSLTATMIFPWQNEISTGVDYEKMCVSFFLQPDLFLRIRPGFEEIVQRKLTDAGIAFRGMDHNILAVHNASKIDSIIELDREAVIQDYNSAKTGDFLQLLPTQKKLSVWDCCAGSGGKSILLADILKSSTLTVSDIRPAILKNLKKRFAQAGIQHYKSFIANLAEEPFVATHQYDLILADVPCTGSGTWRRTPEQLAFFQEKKIEEYKLLQQKILNNILSSLSSNGFLLYITCSVFKKENEEQINWLQQNYPLRVVQAAILSGETINPDTLFAGLLQKE